MLVMLFESGQLEETVTIQLFFVSYVAVVLVWWKNRVMDLFVGVLKELGYD